MEYGDVDAILTSPPYADSFNVKKHTISGIARRDAKMRTEVGGYGDSDLNLGNLKRETYLGEMSRVLVECFKVLKPGKPLIAVVKRIQRKKELVKLDEDFTKLAAACGFIHEATLLHKLGRLSFWRANAMYQCDYAEWRRSGGKKRMDVCRITKHLCPHKTTLRPQCPSFVPVGVPIEYEHCLVFRKPSG